MAHQLAPLSLACLAFAVLLLVSGHMVNGSSKVGDYIDLDSDELDKAEEVDGEEDQTGADNEEGVGTGSEGEAGDSCMVKRMLKAGIPHSTALQYEQRLLDAGLTEESMIATPEGVLEFLLSSSGTTHAHDLQQCLLQSSEACTEFSPCLNAGQCELAHPDMESYACKCDSHYMGDYCETSRLASLTSFNSLQEKVTELEQLLQDRTQFLGSGCNLRTLGYKYQTRYAIHDEKDEGQIASLTFRKKQTNTVLKLTYSSNIRTGEYNGHVRWYFVIDDLECTKPTKLDIGMIQVPGGNDHIPSVLTGVCESTSSAATNIPAGDHTISVRVGRMENAPGAPFGNPHSGWHTTSFLEVQEMCPQF
ncbi:uncharacterized protein LOC135826040 [Sycon ciliatum]|uniref:uncharacterized protein LOC135826040 n=1 Tax=Sycon ciliatum TaxID=27933 RepID=UPI0031F6C91C